MSSRKIPDIGTSTNHPDAAGYPTGSPSYRMEKERVLTHKDHSIISQKNVGIDPDGSYDKRFFVQKHEGHFIRDLNDPKLMNYPTCYVTDGQNSETVPIFSGSTTSVNPTQNPDKQKILDTELNVVESERTKTIGDIEPPISPLYPFTRMDPKTASISNIVTYNRTKIPVADLEFRKGIRHIFFTRPECYLLCSDYTDKLCEQASYDQDVLSTFSRLPHIIRLLSPSYIYSCALTDNSLNHNWNYLLSNRVQGITTGPVTLSVNENTTKSVTGYTVTPGNVIESSIGSNISLTFRDTKNFEIYELLRMWMLYIHKRHRGIFAPPYNNYKWKNTFYKVKECGTNIKDMKYNYLHPYDLALEYTASIYDIVTDETGSKILYWCKYYGVYPTEVSPSLSNDNNAPLTESRTSGTFRYMYKEENNNKSLLEFNYNTGLVDEFGKLTSIAQSSEPFLLRELGSKNINVNKDLYVSNSIGPEYVNPSYVGASGMFVGAPYIVMGVTKNDFMNASKTTTSPYLKFTPIELSALNKELNIGYENILENTNSIISIDDSDIINEIVGETNNDTSHHGGGGHHR